MELFTLGANRGAYTETDVREQARALTGWQGSVKNRQPAPSSSTRPAQRGVEDDLRPDGRLRLGGLVPAVPRPPAAPVVLRHEALELLRADAAAAATCAPRSRPVREPPGPPVVEAILRIPAFYAGPRMVKPPVVFNAGLLRMRGRYVETDLVDARPAGRPQLFYPPDVGGWDDTRWLDTATFRARWFIAALVQGAGEPTDSPRPRELVDARSQFWGFADDHTRRRRACSSRFARRSSPQGRPRRRRDRRCAG